MEWLCFVVLGCRFWVRRWAGSGFGDGLAVLCGAGLRVAVADGVIWCWVAGAGFGDGDWRDRDGETEMRDERQRRERVIKYYYFFTILATVQFYV